MSLQIIPSIPKVTAPTLVPSRETITGLLPTLVGPGPCVVRVDGKLVCTDGIYDKDLNKLEDIHEIIPWIDDFARQYVESGQNPPPLLWYYDGKLYATNEVRLDYGAQYLYIYECINSSCTQVYSFSYSNMLVAYVKEDQVAVINVGESPSIFILPDKTSTALTDFTSIFAMAITPSGDIYAYAKGPSGDTCEVNGRTSTWANEYVIKIDPFTGEYTTIKYYHYCPAGYYFMIDKTSYMTKDGKIYFGVFIDEHVPGTSPYGKGYKMIDAATGEIVDPVKITDIYEIYVLESRGIVKELGTDLLRPTSFSAYFLRTWDTTTRPVLPPVAVSLPQPFYFNGKMFMNLAAEYNNQLASTTLGEVTSEAYTIASNPRLILADTGSPVTVEANGKYYVLTYPFDILRVIHYTSARGLTLIDLSTVDIERIYCPDAFIGFK